MRETPRGQYDAQLAVKSFQKITLKHNTPADSRLIKETLEIARQAADSDWPHEFATRRLAVGLMRLTGDPVQIFDFISQQQITLTDELLSELVQGLYYTRNGVSGNEKRSWVQRLSELIEENPSTVQQLLISLLLGGYYEQAQHFIENVMENGQPYQKTSVLLPFLLTTNYKLGMMSGAPFDERPTESDYTRMKLYLTNLARQAEADGHSVLSVKNREINAMHVQLILNGEVEWVRKNAERLNSLIPVEYKVHQTYSNSYSFESRMYNVGKYVGKYRVDGTTPVAVHDLFEKLISDEQLEPKTLSDLLSDIAQQLETHGTDESIGRYRRPRIQLAYLETEALKWMIYGITSELMIRRQMWDEELLIAQKNAKNNLGITI